MAYTRVNWQDLPSTSTPINATNLNKMDAGIKENDDRLNGTKAIDNTLIANDYECKNLFDNSTMIELVNSARNYSNGNIVSLNGYYGLKIPVKQNTTYVISSNLERNQISNLIYYNGNTYISGLAFNTGLLSFTTPNNCNYITLAVSNTYSWFQLELGSTATTYTPYKKLIKDVGGYVKEDTTFYANDFKCKNMLPLYKNFSIGNLNVYCSDGNLYFNGNLTNTEILKTNTAWKNNFSFTLPAGIYYLSTTLTLSSNVHIAILKYSDDSTLNQDGGTFTLSSETKVYLGFYLFNQTYSNNLIQCQLEVGGEQTPYTPYKNFDNTEYLLYSGNSNAEITLNDSTANYKYIEVFFGLSDTAGVSSCKVYQPNGKSVSLVSSSINTSNSTLYLVNSRYTISTTTMTPNNYGRFVWGSTNQVDTSSNRIYILRVVGYK